MIDRVDIFSSVSSLSYDEIKSLKFSEKSSDIKARVEKARDIQKKRFKDKNIFCNAQMSFGELKIYCKIDKKGSQLIEKIYSRFDLSVRAYSRILKVARTIADLRNCEKINESDLIEAIQYRKFINNNIV